MNKEEVREHMRAYRNGIKNSPDYLDFGERLSAMFNDTITPEPGQIISVYWPMGSEINTGPLILDLIAKGYKVALPITPPKTDDYSKRILSFRLWDGDESKLVEGAFKTMAPAQGELVEPDIFVVPLLAFDMQGNRMGYGQGHYDTTLATARAKRDILVIGVGYPNQAVLYPIPVEPHDQRLDMAITPERVFEFR